MCTKKSYMIGGMSMSNELLENEAFANGIVIGVQLHQQRVIAAHKRKEPLKVGENLYYLETGRERLERVLHEICR